MKQYFLDLCLVLLVLCIGHLYFNDNNIEKVMFERDKVEFEERISNHETLSSYRVIADRQDNQLSLLVLKISEKCILFIEYIVYIFSQMISMLFIIMVY